MEKATFKVKPNSEEDQAPPPISNNRDNLREEEIQIDYDSVDSVRYSDGIGIDLAAKDESTELLRRDWDQLVLIKDNVGVYRKFFPFPGTNIPRGVRRRFPSPRTNIAGYVGHLDCFF